MTIPWHHSPEHRFTPGMTYIVTAGTLDKLHFFNSPDRLVILQKTLLETLERHDWVVQAWAVFVNHYHFVARSPDVGFTLNSLIQELHSISSREVNRLDMIQGRQVWFQYWDTCLTYEKSWMARLNYVHNNPVKHKLVSVAENYPYCSAAWFQLKADSSFRRKVRSFRYDRLKITDDF